MAVAFSKQPFERPGRQAQRQQLGEQRDRRRAPSTKPMARSMRKARRPKAAPSRRTGSRSPRMKPPPKPISAISAARPPRISRMRLRVGALARRQVAAQRHDEIADREQREAGRRPRYGIAFGPDAVGRRELEAAWCPRRSTPASASEQRRDDEAGRIEPRALRASAMRSAPRDAASPDAALRLHQADRLQHVGRRAPAPP